MAKAKSAQFDLRDLSEQILTNALPRVAHLLKPYPQDVPQDQIDAAVAKLADAGLVHPGGKNPNLTRKGAELARDLIEANSADEAKA